MFEDVYNKPIKNTELWSIGTIKQMLIDNVGFSVLPYNTVEKEIESGQLKIIEHNFDFKMFYAYLLTQKQSWTNPIVNRFIDKTKAVFSEKHLQI